MEGEAGWNGGPERKKVALMREYVEKEDPAARVSSPFPLTRPLLLLRELLSSVSSTLPLISLPLLSDFPASRIPFSCPPSSHLGGPFPPKSA